MISFTRESFSHECSPVVVLDIVNPQFRVRWSMTSTGNKLNKSQKRYRLTKKKERQIATNFIVSGFSISSASCWEDWNIDFPERSMRNKSVDSLKLAYVSRNWTDAQVTLTEKKESFSILIHCVFSISLK